jgi:hypothetical protein
VERLRIFTIGGALAVGVHLALAVGAPLGIGVVGEVWPPGLRGAPVAALVDVSPARPVDAASSRWGPFVAAPIRPVERLEWGPLRVPLAINAYTGGLPDAPLRLVGALGGGPGAVRALHLGFGAALLLLVHRFLRLHAGPAAALAGALVLATDWSFAFTRQALGGTEVVLQASAVLALWALWSRRWGGGRHGLALLALACGLGLHAKWTFSLVLAALGVAALALRRDKPRLGPPLPLRLTPAVLLFAAPLLPTALTVLHHAVAPPTAVPSHDTLALQLGRVSAFLSGGPTPARDGLDALAAFLGDPLRRLLSVYGRPDAATPGVALRILGGIWLLGGLAVALRDRHATPRLALLRFTALYATLALLALWAIARDLHHLAVTTPLLAIAAGLAADALAGLRAPPRSARRTLWAVLLVAPLVVDGASRQWATAPLLAEVPVPTFSASGQDAVIGLLRRNGVQRVVAADYEFAGLPELLAPEIAAVHAWPAVARHGAPALPGIVAAAEGSHLIVLRASQPFIYNLRPGQAALQAAAGPGREVRRVDALPGDAAVLYTVEPRSRR